MSDTQASLLAGYTNGGTRVQIYSDGTKVRETFDAGVSPVFPEQMDLKITDWCDAACAWCHEGSTLRGRHGDVDAMLDLLVSLPEGVEVAIGGGDPLSHPRFEDLVAGLRGAGLIPSVTVNGRHFERHKAAIEDLIARGFLFGVGVSFYETFPDSDYPHLVDHMISGVDDPKVLLEASPRKVLVLGYKDWGRGQKYRERRSQGVSERISEWYRLLPLLARKHHLSFDNLAIEQLKPKRLFKSPEMYDKRFMGEEGEHSMYVDGVTQTYALSSYAPDRFEWTEINEMYQSVRQMSHGGGLGKSLQPGPV